MFGLEVGLAIAVSTLFAGLVVVSVLAICGKKKKKIDDIAPAPAPGAPPNAPVPSLNSWKGTTANGIVDQMEAPETVRNTGKNFDMNSINFSNISDFRGDKIQYSTRVQDDRAKSRGISVGPGAISPVSSGASGADDEDSESEYTESETDEEEDEDGPPAPLPRVTIAGRPPLPGMDGNPPPGLGREPVDSLKTDLAADLEAGILKGPNATRSFAVSKPSKNSFNMQNLSFNRDSVDGYGAQAVDPSESRQNDANTMSQATSISYISKNGERKRKKVKRKRKKKKRLDESGNAVKVKRRSRVAAKEGGQAVERKRTRIHKKKSRNDISNEFEGTKDE